MTSRAVVPALSMGLLLLSTAPRAAAEPAEIEGRYHFVGGAGQEQSLREAVEAVINQMSVVIRGIARSRMSTRIFIAPQVSFDHQAEGLRLSHEPLPPRVVRFDGSPLRLSNRSGDAVEVQYRREGERIVETIAHGRNSRTNVYQFSQGGAQMTLAATIRSPYFAEPIRFRLSYRRREPAG